MVSSGTTSGIASRFAALAFAAIVALCCMAAQTDVAWAGQQNQATDANPAAKTASQQKHVDSARAKAASTKPANAKGSQDAMSKEQNDSKPADGKAGEKAQGAETPKAGKAIEKTADAPDAKADKPKAPTEPAAEATVKKGLQKAESPAYDVNPTPLADGTYIVQDVELKGQVLDAPAQSKEDAAPVKLATLDDKASQKWALAADEYGNYTITSKQTGKPLAADGKAKAGVAVNVGGQVKPKLQRWTLKQAGSFMYLCLAAKPKLALGVSAGKPAEGATLALCKAKSAKAQRFYFVATTLQPGPGKTIADGVYDLGLSAKPTQKVDVAYASHADGANVVSYKSNGDLNQRWSVAYAGNGYYRLSCVESGKLLTVEDASILTAANVVQSQPAQPAKASAQLWGITANDDGTYTLRSALSGMSLEVARGSLADGANVRVSYPSSSSAAQRFAMSKVGIISKGTYQLFTKLASNMAVDIARGSLAQNARAIIWQSNDAPNEHFYIMGVGKSYAIRSVSSGKYLTARDGIVVQRAPEKKGGTKLSASQLWNVTYANGYIFRNKADNKALDVSGAKARNGAGLVTWGFHGNDSQRFSLAKRLVISNGLYTFGSAADSTKLLDIAGGSFDNGANLDLWSANGNNNQKFCLTSVGGGYYRITMALSDNVADVARGSKSAGANVVMWDANATAAWQLWHPKVTDGGLVFVNKHSGHVLSAAGSPANGTNVRQEKEADAPTQKWILSQTQINLTDIDSFLSCVKAASGSSDLKLTNGVLGWKPDPAKWRAILNAVHATSYNISFIMTDCSTGMTLTYRPDGVYYGASTIKGLWVTYLFEEYIEKGRLSWSQIRGLAVPTIVNSNNETYRSLRASYGSESGFSRWLNRVGVGYIGLWGYYSPRTLQKAWTHMLNYANSGKGHVSEWKSTFSHSYVSTIHDALGSYRTTYSKPGWMSDILNDSAVVVGDGGRQYLLTIMSHGNHGTEGSLKRVVRAIDALQATMPASR